jgi:hypothetical protein
LITPTAPPRRLLDHILRCNARDESRFRPFLIGGAPVGAVREDFIGILAQFPATFEIDAHEVRLEARLTTPERRTAALREVVQALVERRTIAKFRAESYPVMAAWGDQPLCLIDRGAVAVFGIKAYGIHANGYTMRDGQMQLWIGRRAMNKAVEPGKLDNMIAGGQPAGLSLIDNLVKEAGEEASLPRALALQARPAGAITYCMEGERGLKPDTMFVYDLELPADCVPRPNDDEISAFMLMSPAEVIARLRNSWDFKFNVSLVLIDFLIRTGHIRPETEPDYLALIAGLHPAV